MPLRKRNQVVRRRVGPRKGKRRPGPNRENNRQSVVSIRTLNAPTGMKVWIKSVGFYNSAVATQSDPFTIQTNDLLNAAIPFVQSVAASAASRDYTKYKILAYKYKLHWSARATATAVSLCATNESGSATSPWAGATNIVSDPEVCGFRTKTKSLGSISHSPNLMTMKGANKVTDIVSLQDPNEDPNYVGTVTSAGVFTAPTDLTYLYINSSRIDGIAYGANTSPTILYEIEQLAYFYDARY